MIYFTIQKLSSTNLGKLNRDGVRLQRLLSTIEADRFQNFGFSRLDDKHSFLFYPVHLYSSGASDSKTVLHAGLVSRASAT